MIVRNATNDDCSQIAALGGELPRISSLSPMDYDEAKTATSIASFIDQGQFVQVMDDGLICGYLIGAAFPSWFGYDLIATDFAWYVSPGHKGSGALRMMRSFIKWCKAKGVKQIRPGVSTGDKRAVEIYKRLGFSTAGENLLMTL